jgi:hypothetical protein
MQWVVLAEDGDWAFVGTVMNHVVKRNQGTSSPVENLPTFKE